MKKLLIPTLLAVAAISCNKLPADTPVPEVKLITETVTATSGDGTKASISDGLAFSWTAGDHIAVHVSKGDSHKYVLTSADGASGASESAASANFTIVYEEGYARDAFAVFPSTLVAVDADNYGQSGTALDLTLPASYTLAQVSGTTTPCPMIATNTPGEGWTFKHLCGLLRLTVSGIPTDDGTFLKVDFGGCQVSGAFTLASPVTPGTSTIGTSPGSPNDQITITELGGASEVTVNIPLPAGAYGDVVVTAFNSSNVPEKVKQVALNYTAVRCRGKKLTATLSSGAFFSVEAGKYVIIAPSNLTYTPSTGTWGFHANTYDRYETSGTSTRYVEDGIYPIDLFGWGTSGHVFASGYGSAFKPYATSYTSTDYGPTDGSNLTGTYAAGDWGVEMGAGWRTLTKDEWTYLLNRDGKYGRATVLGMKGLVLLPDSFTDPNTNGGSSAFTGGSGATWSTNVYSLSADWDAMAAAGAVFLPAAGYRNTTSIYNGDSDGYYWSSTASGPDNAYMLHFSSSSVSPSLSYPRRDGRSVRLVKDLL